jgi:hypothetical protein
VETGARPRLISASRRTDLPGFHADECARRLLALRAPVHSVFFWTRHPAGLLRPGPLHELVRVGLENPFVHLTLTGLGGTAIEPRVPTTREVLASIEPLIALLRGQPERVLWRFDPVLRGTMSPAGFAALARPLAETGIRTCIFSFPAQLSLKGPLDEQYARFGIERFSRVEKREAALRLLEVATRHGITLRACCQPSVVEDTRGAIQPAACISAELAVRLHPEQLPLALPKDPAQRRHCTCATSHDLGRYATDRCGSGCAYCYSSAGGPPALAPATRPVALEQPGDDRLHLGEGADPGPREPVEPGDAV